MAKAATPTRHNRTITVDVHEETTAAHLRNDGKACREWVLAFLLSIGVQLLHAPEELVAIASPVRQALRTPFHTQWYRARQRQGPWVFAMGQR